MKRRLNKIVKDERGYGLIVVLVFLTVGSLIISPLLGFMGSGLKTTQVFDEKVYAYYAADAGLEDALHELVGNNASLPLNIGETWSYSIADVNDDNTTVEIVKEEDISSFLEDLPIGGGTGGPHTDWGLVEDTVVAGTYIVTFTYNGTAMNKRIYGVGTYLEGTYALVPGSASGITTDYPSYTFNTQSYRGGTVFTWGWTGANRPVFTPGQTRTMSFQFTPAEVPSFSFSWVNTGSSDLGLVPTPDEFNSWQIISTATDNATGKRNVINAYVTASGNTPPVHVHVYTWESSAQ
jgi:hypothetical protein